MFSLYIHVPFCRSKCPYCDFYSLTSGASVLESYPDLLLRQLAQTSREEWASPVGTIFFGGGTPSLLSPAAIGAILGEVDRIFGLTAGAEISLEANPGTVTPGSLAGYRAAGVNRLSFGIQSMQPQFLQRLGRIHSPRQARNAVNWARRAGFENLSCDLMFALPGQSHADLKEDVTAILNLHPEHIACYGLTIEEQTPFYHLHRSGELKMPKEELYVEQFRLIHDELKEAGFSHYEISNYARPGWECRHNQQYWRRLPYLGVGAGAHSYRQTGWGERLSVPPDLERYSACLARGEDPSEMLERFDIKGAMSETLYLGLRTSEGVAEDAFQHLFGAGVRETYPEAVDRTGGRLLLEDGRWRFDLEGWLLYDYWIEAFL